MAKKFGKFLLFTAAVGSAAAAVYYYMHKKGNAEEHLKEEESEDFNEDLDDAESSKNYVPLTPGAEDQNEKKEDSFVPLDKVAPAAGQESAETDGSAEKSAEDAKPEVEEFFNEDTAAES